MHSHELVRVWNLGERSGHRRHIDSLGKFLSSDEELHRLTTRGVRTCGHRRDGVSLGPLRLVWHVRLSIDFPGTFHLQYLTQKGIQEWSCPNLHPTEASSSGLSPCPHFACMSLSVPTCPLCPGHHTFTRHPRCF